MKIELISNDSFNIFINKEYFKNVDFQDKDNIIDIVKELVKNVVEAVVDEFEEMLKDVDEVCDEELKKVFDEEEMAEEDMVALEARLKKSLERKLAGMGIYSKLERKYKVVKKAAKKNSKPEQTTNILKQYRKNRNNK